MRYRLFLKSNEKGSAMVMALLILAVLTILGISATQTSTIELKIVRNEKLYQKNFYQAEAAAYEAAQRLETEDDPDELRPATTNFIWLKDVDVNIDDFTAVIDNSTYSLINPSSTYYASIARGIATGGSLDMTKTSNVYGFEICGISIEENGKAFIKIGYKKRY